MSSGIVTPSLRDEGPARGWNCEGKRSNYNIKKSPPNLYIYRHTHALAQWPSSEKPISPCTQLHTEASDRGWASFRFLCPAGPFALVHKTVVQEDKNPIHLLFEALGSELAIKPPLPGTGTEGVHTPYSRLSFTHRSRFPRTGFLHLSDLNTEYLDLGFSRGLGSSSRAKRMRTSFKHHQLRTMKSYFAINHNPDAKDLKQLSQKTGLPKRVLQVGRHC